MNIYPAFTKAFDTMFSLSKESVTLHTVTKAWDTNDNYTPSEANSTIDARVESLEQDQLDEFGGALRIGDAIMFVDPDTSISIDDRITHNSIKYKVEKILSENLQNNVVFKECWLKRIHTA